MEKIAYHMTKYGHCFVLAGKLIIILSIFELEEYIIYQSGIVLAEKKKQSFLILRYLKIK